MRKVLMSACLLGRRVRYDGGSLLLSDQIIEAWHEEGRIVPVCPEVDAGMSVPRQPAEILRGDGDGDGEAVLDGKADVVEVGGGGVTEAFLAGASIALALCKKFSIDIAVLTEASPSCGSTVIYDGSFSGQRIAGAGVTTALLRRHGVRVFSQHDIAAADQAIRGSQVHQSGV